MADPIKKITLADGKTRYRFVIDVGRDADGKRKQLTVTRDTRREAEAERARILHERANGRLVLPSKMTVAELLDRYLASKEGDLEESTIRGYRNALCHAYEYLGHIRLQDLTEEHVESMVTWLLDGARRRGGQAGTGLRTTTVDGVLGRLRAALRLAVRRQLVARNVAEYVTVPRKARKADKASNQRPAPWNVAEVQQFLMGIREDRLFACLLLGLMGLRPAEVAGLRWSHIDFGAGTLEIAETRTMIGNRHTITKDTKTEAGTRKLPIPAPVLAALQSLKLLQDAERVLREPYYCKEDYVLVDGLGYVMDTRTLREYAYKLMRRTGLRRVRLYDARHSCLTYLAVNGVPDVVLAAWAGHTNASFTKRVYVQPGVEDLRVAADALGALFGVDSGMSPDGRV